MPHVVEGQLLSSHQRDILLRQFVEGDPSACTSIIASRNDTLVRHAARSDAPLSSIKALLESKDAWDGMEQAILQEAAGSGKRDTVHYILQRNPSMILSEDLRYFAAMGGSVPIWKEFVAHDPNIVNVEIGHFGDALGLAVSTNDLALVRFLLDSGVDVKNSNYVGVPVLEFAREREMSQDIIDLLVMRGAK